MNPGTLSIDTLIRQGRIDDARRVLKRWLRDRSPPLPPREVARCLRRVGLLEHALVFLHPRLFDERGRFLEEANLEEGLEYATSLARLGGGRAALALLAHPRFDAFEDTHFSRAAAHMTEGDYEHAVGELQHFVDSPRVAPYARLVGLLNLSHVLILLSRGEDAHATLDRAEAAARSEHGAHGLPLANIAEMRARLLAEAGQVKEAERTLEVAEAFFGQTGSVGFSDGLQVEKIRALLLLRQARDCPKAQAAISAVRDHASAARHYETIRDLDFQVGRILGDAPLLLRVYFGSPFRSTRAWVKNELARLGVPVPDEYIWVPRSRAGEAPACPTSSQQALHIARGLPLVLSSAGPLFASDAEGLKRGQVPHRLLEVLARDLYKPRPAATLHGALFPEKKFHPFSAPPSLHMALSRLRHWLLSRSLACRVSVVERCYVLDPGSCALVLTCDDPKPRVEGASFRPSAPRVDARHLRFGQRLTRRFVETEWNLSPRSASRVLAAWNEEGTVAMRGSGRNTYFEWMRAPTAGGAARAGETSFSIPKGTKIVDCEEEG